MQLEFTPISTKGLGHIMSAKSRTVDAETRIFMVLHTKVYEQFIANEGARKISVRFREAIEELSKNEGLRNDLRKFYRRHSAFFTKELSEEKGKKIQLHAAPEIPELLSTISFFVLGLGNASLISRILMYHFAVRNKWLPAPPVGETTKKTIEHPNTGTGKRIPVEPRLDKRNNPRLAAYSVDTLFAGYESTVSDLQAIAVLTQLNKSATLRYLIEQAATGDTAKKIKAFYRRKWSFAEGLQNKIVRVRYRIPEKMVKTLDRLSLEIIDSSNRSLTLRTIVAYSAALYGVRPR